MPFGGIALGLGLLDIAILAGAGRLEGTPKK